MLQLCGDYLVPEMRPELRQHSAAAAYAAMMVVVGLPVWWRTTEVYRAPLPYAEIEELEQLDTRQQADVFLLTLEEEEAHMRAPALQTLFKKSDLLTISLNVRPPRPSERKILESAGSLEELDSLLGPLLLQDSPGSVALVEAPSELFTTVPHLMVGQHRLVYYSTYTPSDEVVALLVDTVLGEPALLNTLRSLPLAPPSAPRSRKLDHERGKRSSGSMDLFLTLLVPNPEVVTATWEIERATETLLRPFMDSFPLSFNVKSQVRLVSPLEYFTWCFPPGAAPDSSGHPGSGAGLRPPPPLPRTARPSGQQCGEFAGLAGQLCTGAQPAGLPASGGEVPAHCGGRRWRLLPHPPLGWCAHLQLC